MLPSYHWSELTPRMRRYLRVLGLAVVVVVGLIVGVLFSQLVGFWWALLVFIVIVLVPLWNIVKQDPDP